MDNVLSAATTAKLLAGFCLSLVSGFLGKVFWDYSKGGRVEKIPAFVTTATCKETQKTCGLIQLKEQVTKMYTELETFKVEVRANQEETDEKLKEHLYDIRAMRHDIVLIKEGQAYSNALLESLVAKLKQN